MASGPGQWGHPGQWLPPNQHPYPPHVSPTPDSWPLPGQSVNTPIPPAPHRRTGWWISLAIVVILGLAGGLVALRLNGSENKQVTSDRASDTGILHKQGPVSTEVAELGAGKKISQETVAKIDPGALFLAMFKRQALQKITDIKIAFYLDQEKLQNKTAKMHQTAIDYTNKKFTYQNDNLRSPNEVDTTRCIDGQERSWSKIMNTWRDKARTCDLNDAYVWVSDGLGTSGLTNEQADTFINSARKKSGFLNTSKPSLVETDGKQYIKLPVQFKTVKLEDGRYWGGQILMWGFKETGVDPLTHPYTNGYGPGQGIDAIYYIDPVTLLPAYAQTTATPVLDDNGKPIKDGPEISSKFIQYSFPDSLPPLSFDGPPKLIELGWPAEFS